ncbi:MAG: branched-chain amino acid ABC transporter permease [Alphaproteobacteria bacterium]|nr:branched-chain amino acid ABC transporter permease [Alphaproteobacteria bacterium]
MEQVAIYAYQIGVSFSIFILISLGLAVIFGMMRVINLAQGEFLMLGAYACVLATQAGLSLWLSMFVAAAVVGLFGIVVERVIIRFLYGRIVDTLLATWGLSLFLVGGITTLFGPQSESVVNPLGNVTVGDIALSQYSLAMIAIAIALLIGTYCLWRFTRFGLIVRGTMQNPDMARGLGVNTDRVFMLTFGFGAALTGFAGAVLVPITGAAPPMGVFFIAKAFITVISGGHLPLIGTVSASAIFGAIDGFVAFVSSSVVGEMSVLFVAIILLRLLPMGITGHLRRGL